MSGIASVFKSETPIDTLSILHDETTGVLLE